MIKIANNIQRMLAKQASATSAKFVNHSMDPLRPAFAPEGQLPQSYVDEEAPMRQHGSPKPSSKYLDMPLSKLISPRDFSMRINTHLGQQNSSEWGPESLEQTITHGPYGPTVYSYFSPSLGRIISQTTPFGFGHLYDMSPNQIDKNPQTNFLR